VNGLEQKAPHEAAKPPIDRLPRRKIFRQHPPAASGAGDVADRVQDRARVGAGPAALLGRFGQKWRDPLPLLVGQIRRVALGFLLDVGHPATIRLGPHPQRESRRDPKRNHSQTDSQSDVIPRII
jgi:hypothetical protein